MLNEQLTARDLLPILTMNDGSPVTKESWPRRRQELLEALRVYSYGRTPAAPDKVWSDQMGDVQAPYDNVTLEKRLLSFTVDGRTFSFPFDLYLPVGKKDCPVIMLMSFEAPLYNIFEDTHPDILCREGFALARIVYTDVVNDAHYGDYSDGMAVFFGTDNPRQPEEWGKIGMWAYALSRLLDYLLTRDDLDASRNAIIGHSRLGKTVLWAGAQDERFTCVIDSASGYGGSATSKHGSGECVQDFIDAGSWDWFCPNYQLFAGKEDDKPYDQAYLLAALAPRLLLIGTASDDFPCDPPSCFLTALWASQAWTLLEQPGLLSPDRMPQPGDAFYEGKVGFRMREGEHFLRWEDWLSYLAFLKKNL